jgi:hypothetical protein
VASWVMATVTLRMPDRVLGPQIRPELRARLEPVPEEDRRVALRHLAGEINRWMFRRFAVAQIALAALFLALVWPTGGVLRALAIAALLATLAQVGLLGPIAAVGRGIEFLPRPLLAELAHRFGLLHAAYLLTDLAKMGCVAAAAVVLVRRP